MKKLNLFMILFIPIYFAFDVYLLAWNPQLSFEYIIGWVFALATIMFFPMFLDRYIELCGSTSKHLHKHQQSVISHIKSTPHVFHYMPVGCGKTL